LKSLYDPSHSMRAGTPIINILETSASTMHPS